MGNLSDVVGTPFQSKRYLTVDWYLCEVTFGVVSMDSNIAYISLWSIDEGLT